MKLFYCKAFTLIEILIVAALFSVVLLMSYNLFFSFNNKYFQIQNDLHLIKSKNLIVDELHFHIKNSYKILYAETNKLVLWNKDANNDNIPSHDEWLTISFNKNALSFKTYNTEKIINNIDSLSFYLDVPAPETKHIIIKLSLKNFVFNTGISLRNGKTL